MYLYFNNKLQLIKEFYCISSEQSCSVKLFYKTTERIYTWFIAIVWVVLKSVIDLNKEFN